MQRQSRRSREASLGLAKSPGPPCGCACCRRYRTTGWELSCQLHRSRGGQEGDKRNDQVELMKISLTLHCGKAGACVHNFQCGMVVHHRERGAAAKGGAQEHAGHGATGTDKRLTSWACDIGKQQWMSNREEERTCLDGPEIIWFLGSRPKRQPLHSWCAVRACERSLPGTEALGWYYVRWKQFGSGWCVPSAPASRRCRGSDVHGRCRSLIVHRIPRHAETVFMAVDELIAHSSLHRMQAELRYAKGAIARRAGTTEAR